MHFKHELQQVQKCMSWNEFSRKITKKLITLFLPSTTSSSPDQITCDISSDNNAPSKTIKICIKLPFLGKYGTKLTRSFIRKVTPLLKSPCVQLFQLRLSPSKAEKSNTSAKGLLGIAKILMNFLAIPSKPFALVFDFSALLGDNLN
jgi:hypothetical protein